MKIFGVVTRFEQLAFRSEASAITDMPASLGTGNTYYKCFYFVTKNGS
jgi:hypothetical protein